MNTHMSTSSFNSGSTTPHSPGPGYTPVQFASSSSAVCASTAANVGSIACYDTQDQVGEGTYGYVYRAVDRRDQSVVALKRLIVHKDYLGFPLCAVRELKFLKSLTHPNIVKLKDVAVSKAATHLDKAVKTDSHGAGAGGGGGAAAEGAAGGKDEGRAGGGKATEPKSERDKAKEREQEASSRVLQRCSHLYLVFEYIEHDLGGLIDAKYKFSPKAVKVIIRQLLDVLDFLQEKKILHRDIKCSNILISSHHQIKLADFGLARSTLSVTTGQEGKMDLTNNVVTMWYRAPELLLGATRYTYAVDMWSAGCVLAELELGRPLFPGKSEGEQLDLICRTMGTFSEEAWPEMLALPHYESLFRGVSRYNSALKNFTCNGVHISEPVLALLERVLVANPLKRASANNARDNVYFKREPRLCLPDQLPPIDVGGESLHEFQTKQKRRAKERADEERRRSLGGEQAGAAGAAGAAGVGAGMAGAGGGVAGGGGGLGMAVPPLPPVPPTTNPFQPPLPPPPHPSLSHSHSQSQPQARPQHHHQQQQQQQHGGGGGSSAGYRGGSSALSGVKRPHE